VWKLTRNRFQTYFPHVDNVYSHRSTQEYKRKPFVSHYWDCRLKGRPPGTAKSDDPNKKKRKRLARERDLCDVKIKITEYFPGVRAVMAESGEAQNDSTGPGDVYSTGGRIGLGVSNNSSPVPGANGERYYTISRVNGSNANGRGEVVPGAHQHTLEDSDRVKKNSIQRQQLKNEKERKKSQVCASCRLIVTARSCKHSYMCRLTCGHITDSQWG
jgi:glutathione S-transferase